MSVCKICEQPRSRFIMNNKTVCLRCDELLFDLEIECDEEPVAETKDKNSTAKPTLKVVGSATPKK